MGRAKKQKTKSASARISAAPRPINRSTPIEAMPELLRVAEVAAWMDVGECTIYEAIRGGELPCVRLGRLVRVPRTALVAMAEAGHAA